METYQVNLVLLKSLTLIFGICVEATRVTCRAATSSPVGSYTDKVFKFEEISEEVTLDILRHLNARKATGVDCVSARLLRLIAPGIAGSLTALFNHSRKTGDIPVEWKSANVTPVWKKRGDREVVSNYRPVSVLPIVAKAFQSLVQRQLYKHLQDNSLLHPAQSGFRSFHSIEDVLLKSVDDWRYALE